MGVNGTLQEDAPLLRAATPNTNDSFEGRKATSRSEPVDRVIFFNIAWMREYKGVTKIDKPMHGGAYVKKHGFGSEAFNFKPRRGHYYGYVQPPGRGPYDARTIHIERIGVSRYDDSIKGVTVVWVARSPEGGSQIVGWYKNAEIFREYQDAPKGSERKYKSSNIGFYAKAKVMDSHLVHWEERSEPIPRASTGVPGIGRSNIWYAKEPAAQKIVRKALVYIRSGGKSEYNKAQKHSRGIPRQIDPELRACVEKNAVNAAIKHYQQKKCVVTSYEADNLGWDLEATKGKLKWLIEVKGLSGNQVTAELTPNEFSASSDHRLTYRICIVTDALSESPAIRIFAYNPASESWLDEENNELEIEELTGARLTCRLK